ncbi:MAG: hypothetical protein IPG94_20405 [Kineosporiaceae bacterium]|nr:hypothetical protein [Kineosporiaceae bacterium]
MEFKLPTESSALLSRFYPLLYGIQDVQNSAAANPEWWILMADLTIERVAGLSEAAREVVALRSGACFRIASTPAHDKALDGIRRANIEPCRTWRCSEYGHGVAFAGRGPAVQVRLSSMSPRQKAASHSASGAVMTISQISTSSSAWSSLMP